MTSYNLDVTKEELDIIIDTLSIIRSLIDELEGSVFHAEEDFKPSLIRDRLLQKLMDLRRNSK